MKIVKKAYRVWVHSHIGEYPVFSPEQVEPVYAKSVAEAKYQCDMWDAKNEDGDKARWIDIKCRRAPEYDKIEYNGELMDRSWYQYKLAQEKRNKILMGLDDGDMYYVQDARNYVGNSVLWWGLNSSGYVTDIAKAHKYTKEEIVKRFTDGRETDIVWSAKHIEANLKQHVDRQSIKKEYSF